MESNSEPVPTGAIVEAQPVTATPAGVPTGVAQPASSSTPGGINGPLPVELRGWNWGAFFLNWIWGIAHNVWVALLAFVPFVNIVMPFVLGAKGNEWAWQHRKFESVEQFRAVQKAWAHWGIGFFIASLILSAVSAALLIMAIGMSGTTPDGMY